jgi:hypothetical protein
MNGKGNLVAARTMSVARPFSIGGVVEYVNQN